MVGAVVAVVANSSAFSPSQFWHTPPPSCSPLSIAPPPPLPTSLASTRSEIADESSVLCRKRPARICIPAATAELTSTFSALEERVEEAEVRDDRCCYSAYSRRGKKRGGLEDRFSAVVGIEGDSKQAFFGVFDGHGGHKAAEFAAKNMDKNIMEQMARRRNSSIQEAVRDGYLKTDADFMKENTSGGACCVSALIREGELVVSNVGDCRAVISRGGTAQALTRDHCPSVANERERIENLGGYVDLCRGVWRIQGSLAVSRSIGDRHLKPWVTAEAETRILRITPECEFIILASDGLWDKVSNQEAVNLVRPLCAGVDNPDSLLACKRLVELSRRRGSTDDITVLISDLTRFTA